MILRLLQIVLRSPPSKKKAIKLKYPDILIKIFTTDATINNRFLKAASLQALDGFCLLLSEKNLMRKCLEKAEFGKWTAFCFEVTPVDVQEIKNKCLMLDYAFRSVQVAEVLVNSNSSLVNDLIKVTKYSKEDAEALKQNLSVR